MIRSRLAALLEIALCSGLPTQFVIAGALAAAGVRVYDGRGELARVYVFSLAVLDAGAIIGLVSLFLRARGERVRGVLFGGRRVLAEAAHGLWQIPAVFLLVAVVVTVIQHTAPWLHNVAKNPFAGLIRTPADALAFSVVAVVGGGVREEVQRAFILHRFEQVLGSGRAGLLISSVVFGLGHVIQGWDAAVATACLGAFWGWIYLRRRSVASTVVSHSGFNLAEIIRYTLYGA